MLPSISCPRTYNEELQHSSERWWNNTSWNIQTISFTASQARLERRPCILRVFTQIVFSLLKPFPPTSGEILAESLAAENSVPSAKPWSSNMLDYLTTLALIQSNNGEPNWAPNHATKRTVGPLNPPGSTPVSYITWPKYRHVQCGFRRPYRAAVVALKAGSACPRAESADIAAPWPNLNTRGLGRDFINRSFKRACGSQLYPQKLIHHLERFRLRSRLLILRAVGQKLITNWQKHSANGSDTKA